MQKIFIIEDGDLIGGRLAQCLSDNQFTIIKVSNLNAADSLFEKTLPKIVIIDPYSFSSFGFKLIDKLISVEASPVIIAMSDKRDPEVIVQLIKSGVYDYIVLDRDPLEIEHKIKNGCEMAELQRLKKIHDKELRIINGYFSINKAGGKFTNPDQDAALISSIRTNFSQGSGIGSLLSVISMIEKRVHVINENDKVIIDRDLLTMLLDNSKEVKLLTNAFENMEKFGNQSAELKYDSIDLVYDIIRNQVDQISEISSNYGKNIRLNERVYFGNKLINWVPDYFKMIIHELLLNAIKFSPDNSDILIFTQNTDHGFLISVLNQPDINTFGTLGIPEEFQSMIFEPFFRLSKLVFAEIPTLECGLGLTLVNLLVKKLNGSIKVSNLESYIKMNEKPQQLIAMEVWLPTYSRNHHNFQNEIEPSRLMNPRNLMQTVK